MIPNHLKTLCEKYRDGFKPVRLGKPIKPNPYINFLGFAEYLHKNNYREHTIRQYLSKIHKWNMPLKEQNIRLFDESIEEIYDDNRKYSTLKHSNMRRWRPKLESRPTPFKKRNKQRFIWHIHIVLRKYLVYAKQKKLITFLPDIKEIEKSGKNVKHGHVSKEQFDSFIKKVDNHDLKMLFSFMFYTGSRISETLMMKKTKQWFPTFNYSPNVIFRINIPEGYAKRDAAQKLYINDKKFIVDFTDFIALRQGYIFSFGKSFNKNYIDIMREQNFINRETKKFFRRAGFDEDFIDNWSIHAWRRSNIHYTDEMFSDPKLVQKRARHSTPELTGDYLDATSRELEDALQRKMS